MQDCLTAVPATLPPDQPACWVLHELHELTYPAIAYAIGVPVSTVRGVGSPAYGSSLRKE